MIGHGYKNCQTKVEDVASNVLKLGQFGDWLRVSPSQLSSFKSSSQSVGLSHTVQPNSQKASNPVSDSKVDGECSKNPMEGVKPLSVLEEDLGLAGGQGGGQDISGNSREDITPLGDYQSENNLVEVNVQNASVDSKIGQRRKKIVVKKNKRNLEIIQENMEVESSKVSGEGQDVGRRGCKRPLIDEQDCVRIVEEDITAKLESVQLSESENATIGIRSDDIIHSSEECSRSLFGKIIGQKKANLVGLRRAIGQMWQIKSSVTVKEIKQNFFQFVFAETEDKIKVSKGLNWTFENQLLLLKEWSEGISADHPCFHEVEMWVQGWNIPIHWISYEVGLKLGSAFKKVLDVNVPQGGPLAGKCIRMLVIIDTNKPLLRCTNLQLEQKKIQVLFKYERLVNFCFYCGCLGHTDNNCDERSTDIAEGRILAGRYGNWLKATEISHYASSYYSLNIISDTENTCSSPKPVHQNTIIPQTLTKPPLENLQPEPSRSKDHTSDSQTNSSTPQTSKTIPPQQIQVQNNPSNQDMDTETLSSPELEIVISDQIGRDKCQISQIKFVIKRNHS
ncbi:Unknown protein [Striga hermonthica]|uniref:CCHC-type domain-containing protein n=1 Tax=Striga hermonthica TaxID=68872 RepID=A0A9N7RD17_STRHE|nr:Unknown protein [Striga hermonthica]